MNNKSIPGIIALLSAAGLAGCAGVSNPTTARTEVETAKKEILPPGRIPVRLYYWLCCMPDVTGLNAVVENFNNSQEAVQLTLEFPKGDIRALAEEYASGEGPDIVGPFDLSAWKDLPAEWLDLAPLIRSEGYDETRFNPALVKMYTTAEGQFSLPYMVSPPSFFYNTGLFDKADLAHPPASYGEPYRMPDGSEVVWTWDAVRDVARLLTLDGGGRNAADPGFDESDIRQYGFTWQYTNHPFYWGTAWAPGSMVAEGGSPGTHAAQVPDAWRAAWRWTYDAIWSERPFMGTSAVENSPDFGGGNPFDSGKFATTVSPSWYICCMKNIQTWDVAALPAWNGTIGGRTEESTFRIWKGTRHPKEAFAVLAYLLDEGSRKLIVGGDGIPAFHAFSMPARREDQNDWLDARRMEFPWVGNWPVVAAGLDYAYPAANDASIPPSASIDAWVRGQTFADLLRGTGGLDLDKEITTYLSDLTGIYNRKGTRLESDG